MNSRLSCLIIFLLVLINPCTFAFDSYELLFNHSGTQYINVEINHSQISLFTFNISGRNYNSSYPQNITVDIANDSINDWEYKVYHSNTTFSADRVLFATTNYSQNPRVDFMTNMTNRSTGSYKFGKTLGNVNFGAFTSSGLIQYGNISLYGVGPSTFFNAMYTIITANKTVHVFMPTISSPSLFGFYIAEGGSTYYCHSSHNFSDVLSCDLTAEQAMNPIHLAAEATKKNFTGQEFINNPLTADSINSQLQICGVPCNITIKVSTMSGGNITLYDLVIVQAQTSPANITLAEDADYYNITVNSTSAITNVTYFYGIVPNVYIMPVVAYDDSTNLSVNQTLRYDVLKNSLASAWDNLTNKSHPLNFTFFNTPLVMHNYGVSQDNFTRFLSNANTDALTQIGGEPNIVVIIDIHDYFPDEPASNTRTTPDADGVISYIYLNGFSDTNQKTRIYRYNEEVLRNVLLHELAHTFIFYPSKNNLFYSDHPSSFTDLNGFDTYPAASSPTGSEGYYEIYSILNQLRPYIADSDINNTPPRLSLLDKMLLGITDEYEVGNYTYYSGIVSNISERYNASPMNPIQNDSAASLYASADSDSQTYWDIRRFSSGINMGLSYDFSIPKNAQNNRSIWVYASDAIHTRHFKVFNNNAGSTQTQTTPHPSAFLLSPANNFISNTDIVNFSCVAYHDITNITLYLNFSSGFNANYSNLTGNSINQSISMPDGVVQWNCLAHNNETSRFAPTNLYVIIDTSPPNISSISAASVTNESATITLTLNGETGNATLNYGVTTALGLFRYNSTFNSMHTFYLTNLTNSTAYYYNITTCDVYNHCNQSGPHNFTTSQTIYIDTTPPWTNITFPSNNSVINNTDNLTINFTAYDDNKTLLSCDLYLNNTFNQSNNTVINGFITYFHINGLSFGYYSWFLICTDSNQSNSSLTMFFSVNDTTPPKVTSVYESSVSNDSAIIHFNTDEAANHTLMYGTTPSLDNRTYNSSLQSIHTINLTGLRINQTYHYNITSCDAHNNCNMTRTYNFTTLIEKPIILDMSWNEWWTNETTNLSAYSRAILSNISGANFSNQYGKIVFTQNLNLSNQINLSEKIRIIKEKLWINSTQIPEFNRSARIIFRNITFTTPTLFKDDALCGANTCTNRSYNTTSKEYHFTVTGFSTYELKEQCINQVLDGDETGVDCGGSCGACPADDSANNAGGGGGSASVGGGGGGTIILVSEAELKSGYTHELMKTDQFKINISNNWEFLKLANIGLDEITINTTGTPKQKNLRIGEESYFFFSGKNISLTLNMMNTKNASITIIYAQKINTPQNQITSQVTAPVLQNNTATNPPEEQKPQETNQTNIPFEEDDENTTLKKTLTRVTTLLIPVMILLAIIGITYLIIKKSSQKKVVDPQTSKLVDYIRQASKRDIGEDRIIQNLKTVGWNLETINQAVQQYKYEQVVEIIRMKKQNGETPEQIIKELEQIPISSKTIKKALKENK